MKDTLPPLRLVDFLIELLRAHASTLQRMAAFYSEEILLELLENPSPINEPSDSSPIDPTIWAAPAQNKASHAYLELENAVREANLPAIFEFYLWAYPAYRKWIESDLQLDSTFVEKSPDTLLNLIDQTVKYTEIWLKTLTIQPVHAPRIDRIVEIPWLRFRTEILKKSGKNPLRATLSDSKNTNLI